MDWRRCATGGCGAGCREGGRTGEERANDGKRALGIDALPAVLSSQFQPQRTF